MNQNTLSVFAVLRIVRDARCTRNAERQLLDALALRCQPAKKFLSWPSYRQLAVDTQLDEVTLKRAAKRLERKGLIKRVVRRNRSNCFYLNVALLQSMAAAVKAADEAAKHDVLNTDEESPFASPVPDTVAEQQDTTNSSDWMSGGGR